MSGTGKLFLSRPRRFRCRMKNAKNAMLECDELALRVCSLAMQCCTHCSGLALFCPQKHAGSADGSSRTKSPFAWAPDESDAAATRLGRCTQTKANVCLTLR